MSATAQPMGNLMMSVTQEIFVRASLEKTFEALLDEIGPRNETGDGTPMPMKLEPWPGGRWYRDLGSNEGHLWALVQAVKYPTLLEFTGPLFMSAPVFSNVQYRLSASGDGTLIRFRHSAFGPMDEDQKTGMSAGWTGLHGRVKLHAEKT